MPAEPHDALTAALRAHLASGYNAVGGKDLDVLAERLAGVVRQWVSDPRRNPPLEGGMADDEARRKGWAVTEAWVDAAVDAMEAQYWRRVRQCLHTAIRFAVDEAVNRMEER